MPSPILIAIKCPILAWAIATGDPTHYAVHVGDESLVEYVEPTGEACFPAKGQYTVTIQAHRGDETTTGPGQEFDYVGDYDGSDNRLIDINDFLIFSGRLFGLCLSPNGVVYQECE